MLLTFFLIAKLTLEILEQVRKLQKEGTPPQSTPISTETAASREDAGKQADDKLGKPFVRNP